MSSSALLLRAARALPVGNVQKLFFFFFYFSQAAFWESLQKCRDPLQACVLWVLRDAQLMFVVKTLHSKMNHRRRWRWHRTQSLSVLLFTAALTVCCVPLEEIQVALIKCLLHHILIICCFIMQYRRPVWFIVTLSFVSQIASYFLNWFMCFHLVAVDFRPGRKETVVVNLKYVLSLKNHKKNKCLLISLCEPRVQKPSFGCFCDRFNEAITILPRVSDLEVAGLIPGPHNRLRYFSDSCSACAK